MSEENMQSTTEQVKQILLYKLTYLGASDCEVVSVSQESPIEPYSVEIRIVPDAGGSGSLSTQANALAAQIINALDLTKATVNPITIGEDGKAFMTLQAEYQPA